MKEAFEKETAGEKKALDGFVKTCVDAKMHLRGRGYHESYILEKKPREEKKNCGTLYIVRKRNGDEYHYYEGDETQGE